MKHVGNRFLLLIITLARFQLYDIVTGAKVSGESERRRLRGKQKSEGVEIKKQ